MKTTRKLLTGNGAVAWAVRLADVDYIPAFPITPQTEIIEMLANWIDNGDINSRLVTLDSEHSMLTAAGAAAATGVRVFTATSSQGLLYAMEMLFTVSGWRVPFVLVNVSRGLASPITLEPDHNDVLATRDSGFLQIHCATCQEVLDTVLIAYRLAEHSQVRLPIIVNLDGFYLSFTREPVTIPDPQIAREFIKPFDDMHIQFRASAPESQAVAVLGGSPYSYFRYETHLASLQALCAYQVIAKEYAERFGRYYDVIEEYKMQDADYAFYMIGCFATKAKEAVDRLRESGCAIGLIRPRMVRPYPAEIIRKALCNTQAVAVIDQNISMGSGGILFGELATALYGWQKQPKLVSFIGGLGGRDIQTEEFYEMVKYLKLALQSNETISPRLLYTKDELREVKKLQNIAHAERNQLD